MQGLARAVLIQSLLQRFAGGTLASNPKFTCSYDILVGHLMFGSLVIPKTKSYRRPIFGMENDVTYALWSCIRSEGDKKHVSVIVPTTNQLKRLIHRGKDKAILSDASASELDLFESNGVPYRWL